MFPGRYYPSRFFPGTYFPKVGATQDYTNFLRKKNLQGNQPLYLYTIFDYDGASNDLNFCAYPTAITYDSIDYTPFPINHESVGENLQGQIDQVRLILGNVSRLIQAYLETYDLRSKKVRIRTVFKDLLNDPESHIDDVFYIEEYTTTVDTAEFVLSSKFDLMKLGLPLRLYSRNHCAWKFKGTECAYAGGETACDKTLQRCRELGNQQRFGAFPSIPFKRLIV